MKNVYNSIKAPKTAEIIITFIDEKVDVSPQSFIILTQTIYLLQKKNHNIG